MNQICAFPSLPPQAGKSHKGVLQKPSTATTLMHQDLLPYSWQAEGMVMSVQPRRHPPLSSKLKKTCFLVPKTGSKKDAILVDAEM